MELEELWKFLKTCEYFTPSVDGSQYPPVFAVSGPPERPREADGSPLQSGQELQQLS